MQKTIISFLAVALLVAGGWYVYSHSTGKSGSSETVAVVNGKNISQSELESIESELILQQGLDKNALDNAARSALQDQALEALISRTVIQQAALGSAVTVSPEDIEQRKDALSSQFENEEAFMSALASAGLTLESLETEIATDIKVENYLMETLNLDEVTASEEEIVALYNQGIAGVEDPPALSEVRDQVSNLVIQQKQQALILDHIQTLKSQADIKILI